MITDAYNLIDVLFAGGIGVLVGGGIVLVATISVRNDAAADRAEAKQDLADARATMVAAKSAGTLPQLHPAYGTETAEWRMVEAEPRPAPPAAEPERCHACGHVIGQHSGPGVQAGRERCWVVDCACRLSGAQARAVTATEPEPDSPVVALATARDCDGWMWQEQDGDELGQWRQLIDGESVGEAFDLDTLEHEHGPVTILFPDGSEGSAADLIDRPEPDSLSPAEGIPAAACCTGHGDEPCAPDSDLVPPYCCGDCPDQPTAGTDLVPVDEPPVTAADLAPIGPDRMPGIRWYVWATAPLTVPLILLVAGVVFFATLAWLGWDRAAEWWADRRQRRDLAAIAGPVPVVEMELEHPAPAAKYRARHRAGAR